MHEGDLSGRYVCHMQDITAMRPSENETTCLCREWTELLGDGRRLWRDALGQDLVDLLNEVSDLGNELDEALWQ